MRTLIVLCLVAAACAQYEAGFVKILQDKRYQDGSTFGNYRDQEDGIKYFEETNAQGIRTGYWEYPSEDGTVLRTEFEAGPGIGFRITNSNHHAPTPVHTPQAQFQPAAAPRPVPAPLPVAPPTLAPARPHHVQNLQPAAFAVPSTTPGPQNLFDYPGTLEFSRSNQGHRFKFTAV